MLLLLCACSFLPPARPKTHKLPRTTTTTTVKKENYAGYNGFAALASGLSCGLSCLAAGMAIGIVGDAGVRANGQQPRLFVSMILILIFAEALALYGLIISLILSQVTAADCTQP